MTPVPGCGGVRVPHPVTGQGWHRHLSHRRLDSTPPASCWQTPGWMFAWAAANQMHSFVQAGQHRPSPNLWWERIRWGRLKKKEKRGKKSIKEFRGQRSKRSWRTVNQETISALHWPQQVTYEETFFYWGSNLNSNRVIMVSKQDYALGSSGHWVNPYAHTNKASCGFSLILACLCKIDNHVDRPMWPWESCG